MCFTLNNFIAYLNISACYYLLGDINQAITSVNKSLTIAPDPDGFSNLGTYYFILKISPKSVIKSSVISHNKGNDLGYALGYLRNAKYA